MSASHEKSSMVSGARCPLVIATTRRGAKQTMKEHQAGPKKNAEEVIQFLDANNLGRPQTSLEWSQCYSDSAGATPKMSGAAPVCWHPGTGLLHRPAVAKDTEQGRPCLSLPGGMAIIGIGGPEAANHLGKIWTKASVHFLPQVFPGVDARLELPCWHVRGMSASFEGVQLLASSSWPTSRGCRTPTPDATLHQTDEPLQNAGQQPVPLCPSSRLPCSTSGCAWSDRPVVLPPAWCWHLHGWGKHTAPCPALPDLEADPPTCPSQWLARRRAPPHPQGRQPR